MTPFTHSADEPLPYTALIKIPRQPRSIEMVHCILDAGMEIIRSTGLQSMSTNRVADRAGVSIGSLYQYFANRESILAGIIERSVMGIDRIVLLMQGQKISAPAEEMLRGGLLMMLRYYEPYLSVMRPILRELPLLAQNSAAIVIEKTLADAMRTYLLNNSDRYRPAQGYAGIYVAVNSLIFTFLRWVIEPFPMMTEEQFVDALVQQSMSAIEVLPEVGPLG